MKKIFKKALVWYFVLISKILLRLREPKIIAVVGNLGKTSTKENIASILEDAGLRVRYSQKSFNSEIGVPLSILGITESGDSFILWLKNMWLAFLELFNFDFPKYLVLELGVDRPGDFDKIFFKIDILVLVAMQKNPVHLANFKNKKELIDEKKKVLKHLKPNALVIYDKDSWVRSDFSDARVLSYSLESKDADVYIDSYYCSCKDALLSRCTAELIFRNEEKIKIIQTLNFGKQQVFTLMPAIAVSHALGLPVRKVFEQKKQNKGRMALVNSKRYKLQVIDDTYNSSPKAALALINFAKGLSCADLKIALLADMLELGKAETKAHKEVLESAKDTFDLSIFYGDIFYQFKKGYSSDNVVFFKKSKRKELIDFLLPIIEKRTQKNMSSIIFAKGSQGMLVEEFLKEIDPSFEEFLVRQDEFWKKKKAAL